MNTKIATRWAARALFLGWAAVGVGTWTGGCGTSGTLCDAICDCQLCNDREEDDCIIEADRALDIADAYDCNDEADAAANCTIDNNDCDDNVFQVSTKCSDDFEDLYDCINDNSDLGQVSAGNNGQTGPEQPNE